MKNYAHIASRVLNTPLLLEPGYARTFFSALSPRLNITTLLDAEGEQLIGEKIRMPAASFGTSRERDRPYQIIDGVAVVPITGSLTHKLGRLKPYSGMTGYDGIIAQTHMALNDPEVLGILHDYDTPGGEVAGCFDTARQLRMMVDKSDKPMWSLAYDMHCSAGMALASSASHRMITQTAVAGSVGVVMAHADQSKMMEEQGIQVTLIHSGSHKVSGNPYQQLSEQAQTEFQASTDQLRREFAQLVADHTGLSLDAVLATEAQVYRGQQAIDIGFADSLVNGHEAIAEFSHYLSTKGKTISLGVTMSKTDTDPENVVDLPAQVAQADARSNERTRIQAITGHQEAEGRSALAQHLAFKTDMSADEAGKLLAASPQTISASLEVGSALDNLMAQEEQPNIGADIAQDESQPDQVAAGVSAYRQLKGIKNVV
ncbi:S49 family peptidase [Gammaproteobacteria bacterium AS21]